MRTRWQYSQQLTSSSVIPRLSSIDPLLISEDCIRQLLTHLEAFAPVVDMLHAFCRRGDDIYTTPSIVGRTVSASATQGGFFPRHRCFADAAEMCFLMQHIERHGRAEQSDPWSRRQTGVYYRRNAVLKQDSFLLISPSMRLQDRLKGMENGDAAAAQTFCVIVDSCNRNWTESLDYHETEWEQIVSLASNRY